MARPKYVPPDPKTVAAIEHVKALYRQWRDAEAEYKRAVTELTDPTGLDVPIAHMATELGVERKTVYRHTGRSMT